MFFTSILGITPSAQAHNLDQQDTSITFDKATLDMMAARAGANLPLIQANDSIGLILKSTPGPGTATGAGGYMTFYIPPGTQVQKAEYGRPTPAGGFNPIAMKGPSIMAVGDGSVGSASTAALIGLNLGPNAAGVSSPAVSAAGVHNGTLAGVYGDVGVFYSTDPQTVFQSFAALGGYDRNIATSDNILTNNRGEAKVPITRWDAEQLIAFGLSSPAAPIIDPNGRGNSPWGTASAVAGPQSGYQWAFDWDYYLANPTHPDRMRNSIVTGPWQRIQHPGSTIAKDQPGLKSTILGFATADASTLGLALAPGTPLDPTLSLTDNGSPKAVRFSYGGLVLGQSEYARIQLKILAAPGDPNSPFDANGCFNMYTDTFGGDAGGEQGGKDHLWRYYDPTIQTINPCSMLQKRFSKTPLAPGETSYFELSVINTGTTAMNNVVISDPMPAGLTYVSATPAPSSTAPLTFTLGTVPAQGFVNIRVNFTATGSGTIFNTATLTSSAGSRTAMDSVDIGLRSLLDPTKSVTPSSTAPGTTVTYAVTITNNGTSSNGTPLVLTDVLPAGFTYSGFVSAQLNGAAAPSGSVTVSATDPTRPVWTITQGIQAGKTLVINFTALISGTQASGTYGNSVSMNYEGKVVTSGSLAPVTVGGGKIGDTIFRDWDGDGAQDSTDEGISGVSVQLWSDPNGDGVTSDGALLQTTSTNSSGQYLFAGLTVGNYVVKVPTPPAGYTQTADPQGAIDNAAKLTLAFNQEVYTMDFGYRPAGAGSIGDTVFEDLGNDGTLSAGDPGIEGITVNLYEDTNGNGTVDAGDAVIATTATDVDGNYLFSGLATGLNYIARVDVSDPDLPLYFSPESYLASTPVSKSVTNLTGSNLTADFGFWRSVPASLGDKVFVDANGNGTFDAGDSGIPSVGVKLYRDTNENGIADPAEFVSTQQTDINGNYLFANLGTGTYIAVLDTADTDLPGGLTPSTSQYVVTLDPGENYLAADFPLVSIFSKIVDKASANAGDTLTYTIIPRWPNSDLLTNARVTDAVPTGTTFLNAGQTGSHSLGTVTWNLGTNSAGTTGHAGETPQTVVLGDVTAETIGDTFIKENGADNNFGTDTTMLINGSATSRKRGLIKWNLSGLPSGTIITGAKLKFTVTAAKSQTATVHQATTAWDEGAGNAADGADWTKADDSPTDLLWTTAGGDFNATSLGSFSMAATGQKTVTSTNLTNLVQAWVNGTANNGILIQTTGTAGDGKIGSSENNTAASRPVLEITYLSTTVTVAAIAAIDTHIDQRNPTTNSGTATTFSILDDVAGDLVKDIRGLVQWSTSGIPAGATITSAELKFNVDTQKAFVVSVHPLTKSWDELQATWNIPATGATWTSLGAEGDYGTSLGTIDVATTGYKSLTGTVIKNLVQGWVDSPSTNKGVFLKFASGALGQTAKISSSEELGKEPLLLVTYELPTTDTTFAATGTLVTGTGAQNVTVAMRVAMGGNSVDRTITPPTNLTPVGTNVGTITKISGPAPASQIIPAGGGTATFSYTYTVVPGASPGSVTFSGVASGPGAAYLSAISNSVLVSPPLTFQVTVNGPPAQVGAVDNVAVFQDNGVIAPTFSPHALTALSGSIGDLVWADLNGDGVHDPGEPGLSAVEVCATNGVTTYYDTTDGNGIYRIFNLGAGNWTVSVTSSTIPAGYSGSTLSPLTVTLAANQQYDAADFGFRPPPVLEVASSIGDTLWIDANENGTLDPAEALLPDITVKLYNDTNNNGAIDAGDVLVTTTATDSNGVYSFAGLYAGDYLVSVDTTDPQFPAGVELVRGGANGAGLHDVTLAAATNLTTADFGYNYGGSIGDYLWYDLNGDKIQNNSAGEIPVPNAVVTLYSDANNNGELEAGEPILRFTTTDNNGAYLFDNLPAGNYIVKVEEQEVLTPPSSPNPGLPARMQASTGTKKAVTLAAGQDYTLADFGFLEVAKVEGHVFYDANGNGVLDPGESILPNVTVTLTGTDANGAAVSMTTTTDADGEYKFLPPSGTYTVAYNTADSDIPAALATRTTPVSFLFSIASGNEVENLNFGVDNTGSIGDTIFANPNSNATQDSGEPGLANVVVNLFTDAARTILLDSKVTDSSGKYLFTGLADGTYYTQVVTSTLPAGYNTTPTADPNSPNDSLGTATVASGGAVLTQDFGYTATVATFAVSGTIFKDLNTSGTPNVPGEQLTGVTVTAVVTTGAVSQTFTTTTDSNGLYTFAGIPTGSNVTVTVSPSTLGSPAYVQTVDPDGANNNTTSIPNVTANVIDKNFGYVLTLGSIAGTVVKGDGDGLAEIGEPVQTNVPVTLIYAGNDGIEGTGDDQSFNMLTNGTGDYLFTGLLPGNYSISTSVPSGYAPLADRDGTNPNSIAVALTVGQNKVDQDFEYQASSVSNYVWNDADGDGVQDVNELPLAGVRVYVDVDGDNTYNVGEPNAITDTAGLYLIDRLSAGTLSVRVDTNTLPTGTTPTYDLDGFVTPHEATVVLAANQNRTDVDFGYQGNASIGDYIWNDANGNGAQDPTELPLSGVKVFIDLNDDGVRDANEPFATTSSTGAYTIGGLIPGTYTVVLDSATKPAETTVTGDPENDMNGKTIVTLIAGQAHATADFGLQGSGSISGKFVIGDGNGIADVGEAGLGSVTISLLYAGADGIFGNGDDATQTIGTAPDGSYSFSHLLGGNYRISKTTPAGYSSLADADGGDADLINVTLNGGQTLTAQDFEAQSVTVSGKVWDDANGSANNTFTNIPSAGESGTNAGGLYAILVDSAGSVVKSTAVNPDGTYAFAAVVPASDYSVLLSTSAGSVGQPAPTTGLPVGWVTTSPLTWTPFAVATTNVTGKDFGIEQPPTATDLTAASQINPGGTTTVSVPALTGSDPEDASVTTFVIKTLPTNGTLYYDGTPVVVDSPITSFNPALLTVDPDNGSLTVTFTYSSVDAAGRESAPATVEMPFTGLTISGNVFNDANGLTDSTVNGSGTDAGATLYANLVSAGLVVQKVAIANDGTYSFPSVSANTTYTIVLSTTEGTIGSAPPAASLPPGYVNTGENLGAAAGDDGTIDGALTVAVTNASLTQANFGIEQPPTADPLSAPARPNLGGAVTYSVPALSGTDPEDPTLTTFVIRTLPTNGTLYYDGTPAVVDSPIPNFNPAKLTVDPDDGTLTMTFSYSVIDAAEQSSPPALVEVPFTTGTLIISGQVRDDYDSNGQLSDPDRPIPGVTVSLYWDTDGDGVRDNGEPLITTAVTDSTGYYLFENLSDGHYILVETDPAPATSTGDIVGDPTDNLIPIELTGSSSIGNDFLDAVDPAGYIYASATGQIIWGGSITVNGPGTATILMDGTTGQYSFITDGTAGPYIISFTPPTGWTVDPARPASLSALIATGLTPDPYPVGSAENPANPGYLLDYSAASNTYYFTFVLAAGDPFVINNNFPLVETKPTSWASWQYNNGLGGSNGPTQNADGDSYDNLQEYAFCLPGNNGLNAHCPLEVVVNGANIDANITTVTGITDVTYTLEYIADLRNSTANGGGWTPVSLIPTSMDNLDGTTTVTYADLESLPGLSSGHGFVRVIVDLASPATTTRTYAAGWQDRAITENCETCSNPFLKCEIFSGAVTSNTSSVIDLSGSIPLGSIRAQLINGRTYYAEVTAGPLVGNRWWIVNASSTATTISVSTGTTALTANALVGSTIVVREAHTFAEMFPPADFHAGNSLVTADKILVYDPSTPSKWVNYFLADLSGAGLGIHWVRSTDPITNRDATPLEACQGIFIHHRAATVYTTQVGQVRENQFACPLKPGYNLVGGGFPVIQTPYDRAMTWDGSTFNGFAGNIDSARSDTLLFWKGDYTLGAENYINYWLVDAGIDPYRRWALQEDNSVLSQDTTDLFGITRAAFYETETGNPGYIMPTGWTP